MGTITERRRKDGTATFFAQIMRRNAGKPYRESKTFEREKAAKIWIEKREKELDRPGGMDAALALDPTLGEAIERYIADSRRAMGRTKEQVLRSLKAMPIADMRCSEIKSHHVVELAEQLAHGRQPQTVGNYLSHLGAVFAVARPAWGVQLDQQAMRDAYVVAKRLGVTGKSRGRERRPSVDEVKALLAHFEDRSRRRISVAPMADIIKFALFSTRRLEEITRIEWADFDAAGRILVRDMKNPGDKAGNNVWCDLPEPAVNIVFGQAKAAPQIFPFGADAISAAFTRACKILAIEDLHFHDLRHEGVSRLFEMGLTIPHVAAVSGHRSWSSLKRYTHIRQTGDKWSWLSSD